MDPPKGYTSEQQALIERLKDVAGQRAAIDEAAETAAETVRRLQALGFWPRLYVSLGTRCWSTAAWILFALSKRFPSLRAPAISAGRRVLQPPSLYPEFRGGPDAHGS